MNIDAITLAIFIILFGIFAFLGFYGSRWRKGDLNKLSEWSLGGRRLGTLFVWFLLGADLFTAYTFIAVPAGIFASGSLYFFAVPYVAWGFGVALLTMPRLWNVSRNKGYVTASDFVKDRFNSKTLAILVALTGIVAELPYIALQIVGMEAVLDLLLLGFGISSKIITEISLVIAFIILAAFTFVSGLRGAALTGVFKDILVWITVITVIIVVPLKIGGFSAAFHDLATNFAAYNLASVTGSKVPPAMETLPSKLIPAYFSLALGSSFALYLYPHAINGSLSSQSEKKLVYSTSLLPIYGIGLVFISLFGVLVYAVPSALGVIAKTGNGALVVPALIASTMPSWFVGIAYLAIFVGGLVPASIMAIASANLFVRNVVKEFKPDLPPMSEAKLAKWFSTLFKFIALGFVFVVPSTYAIQLQLLGGIIVTQTLPAIFLALYTDKLEKNSVIAGWTAGILSGVGITYYVNFIEYHFGVFKTSLFTTPLGPIFIALIALGINLAVTLVGTAIAYGLGWKPKSAIKKEEIIKANTK